MGNIPSFCTSCYRAGRTGEHFMKVAKSKFVHNYCIPNAMFTLKEYLIDYATPETKAKGETVLQEHLDKFKGDPRYNTIVQTLEKIENGQRDLRL